MTSPTLSELVRLQSEATPGPWRSNREGFAALAQDNTVAMRAGPHSLMVGSVCEAFSNVEFAVAARNFDFASLQTQYEAMRELATNWIRDAEHKKNCDFHYDTPGCVRSCSCGLSALRASLDTKARGDGK